MFSNVGPTHPKAAEADVDDVEGHRIAMFVEKEKDALLGTLPTGDDAAAEPAEDVHADLASTDDTRDGAEDDVEGHVIRF